MGSKQQTTTSQSSTTPTNAAGLQSIYNQVQSAASNPYNPYGGQLTAGINDQQQQGIAGINSAAGTAQPYYQQAAQYAASGAAPISTDAIQGYQNPYTKSVIDATQANFNESNGQQQQQVKGNLALSGALGGSRQAVAQAETARQQQLAQAPVIAGLNQQNYTQALAAAQADRTAQQYGAGAYAGIGSGAQTAALQGAGAQLGAGTQEQQTQQAALDAQYKQYLQQQAFPYQQAQFFSQYGLPAALAQGSTTNGTQTAPGPSLFGQIAGLGIAGAGVASKFAGAADGGRITYATGGAAPFNFITDAEGYIPTGGNAPQVSMPQAAAPQFAKPQQADLSPITTALGGIEKGSLKNPFASSGSGGWGASSTDAGGVGGFGGLYADGGLVDAIHHIHHTIKRSRGGAVIDVPFQGFAKGGNVRRFADGGDTTFDDRFGAAFSPSEPPAPIEEPFRLAGPEAMDAWRKGVGNPAEVADASAPQVVPQAAPAPANSMRAAALPPQITGPDSEEEPSSALAYDSTGKNPMSLAPQAAPEAAAPEPSRSFLNPFKLSGKGSDALIATGLGMLASKSPFAGVALGEGGLHGLKSYSDATAAEREAADKKITQAQNQKRIDFEAQRIAQSASQFTKTNSLAERRQKLAEDKTPEGYRTNKDGNLEFIPGGPTDPEKMRRDKEAQGTKFVPAGSIMGADGTLRPAIMEQSTGKIIDAVSGKPVGADDKVVPKGAKAPLSQDDAKALASYYVKTGDASRLNGMGITGEARQMVQHYVTEVQKEQKVSDEELATRKAEWEGRKAGQRTLGTMEAKMGAAANEAEGAIKLTRGIIEKLPRTSFLPLNKLIQGAQANTLSPDQAELHARTQAIINTYSAVMARGANITTDSSRHKAESLLNTANNPEVFNRVLDTLLNEIDMAKHSPAKMREFYRQQYGEKAIAPGGGSDTGSPAAAPTSKATTSVAKPATVTQNGHTYTLQPDGSYK